MLVGAAVLTQYLDVQEIQQPGHVETVSPFTEVSSLAELEDTVGFAVEELTELPFPVTDTVYTAFGSDMAEIRYCGETETAVLRKAVGIEDPSGDYTQYAEELVLDVNGTSVTLKGENGQYVLTLWKEGGLCLVRPLVGREGPVCLAAASATAVLKRELSLNKPHTPPVNHWFY